MSRILVTGGAGYVGSMLVPALLEDNHEVTVYDTFWFGDHLPHSSPRLSRCHGDIRNIGAFRSALALGAPLTREPFDTVIHLACLSNDPSSALDTDLTRAINYDAFEPLVVACHSAGVRRFINCSTSSVYGVSDAPDVCEDHPHVPLTLYNTLKSQCEKVFEKYHDYFECAVTIRPSTVCGYAPRQRLDLAVNILTNQAYHRGVIRVFGGQQRRPNLHIGDMVDCYRLLVTAPHELLAGQVFNVGAGNVSIIDLAHKVQVMAASISERTVAIQIEPIQDERSYQVNSDRIAQVLGFRPRRTVEDAIVDLWGAFDQGLVPDPMGRDVYYNVRHMRTIFADLYGRSPPPALDPREGVLSEIDHVHRGAGRPND